MANHWIQSADKRMEQKGTVGSFTRIAKRHNKSPKAFASEVMAHKNKFSASTVKKANFARNI